MKLHHPLDTISERYVKNITKQLASIGKTIIIIAHRLSTIKDADSKSMQERLFIMQVLLSTMVVFGCITNFWIKSIYVILNSLF